MRKNLLTAVLVSLSMLTANGIAMAENTVSVQKDQQPFVMKERPKFYDKDGNELKARPQPGTKIYDKNGKEIQFPSPKHKMKFYDKNGKELTAPPKPGEKVYDKNGKEIEFKKPHHPRPELNLTEEQKAQADKMRAESQKKMKPLFQEMRKIDEKISKIYDNDKLSQEDKEKQVKPLMEKKTKLHMQADELRKADMKKFEEILTDEQKAKLEEFKKTHKPPRKGFRGGRMMTPPPSKK